MIVNEIAIHEYKLRIHGEYGDHEDAERELVQFRGMPKPVFRFADCAGESDSQSQLRPVERGAFLSSDRLSCNATLHILPAFDRYPAEAAIIGRMLAGYGELEFGVCVCMKEALVVSTGAFG